MSASVRLVVVVGALALGWPANRVAAQAAAPKWEVEVHGGGLFANSPTSGTPIAQFPTGTALATGGGTTTSRAVSSWYFGDGSVLINQVNTSFAVAARVTPLDAALKQPLAQRKGGLEGGVRVSRRLTSRLAAEFILDYGPGSLEITKEASDAIEASRSSFAPAWLALLGTGATTNRTATSTADLKQGSSHDLSTTGTLRIGFGGAHRLSPYAMVGGGALFHRGSLPSATLTGTYGFLFSGVAPVNERDVATVAVRRKDRVAVGVFGGGAEYHVSPRHGVRADVRVHLSGNRTETVVSANPSVTLQSPIFAVSTPFVPSIQFSNSQSLGRSSSLSGPAIVDLETFKGSGVQTHVHVTVGYYVRF